MKRSKVDNWKANKEAHVEYEKLLSKYLKEKKAAYKKDHEKPAPAAPSKPVEKAPAKAPAKDAKKDAKKDVKAAKPAPAKAAAPSKPAAPAKAEKKKGKK